MYIFISISLGSGSERIVLVIYVRVYCLCLPVRFFTFSGLTFRSLIYFVFIFVYGVAANSLQSCPTLCDPIDGSPPGFPVPGILKAGTLEWVVISFSNA